MFSPLITFTCIQIFVTIFVVSFNIIGIYLLLQPNTYEYSQKVCFLHLSIIKVLFLLAQNAPFLLDMSGADRTVSEHVWLLIFCALVVPWCNIMFVLTTDNFIQVLLNTQRQTFYYKTKNTTRFVVVLCWFVGVICYIATVVSKDKFKVNSLRIMHMYVIQIYHAFIVLTFVCTYGCLYYRLRKEARSQKRKCSEFSCDTMELSASACTSRSGSEYTIVNSTAGSSTTGSLESGLSETISTASRRVRANLAPIFIALTYILFVMIPEFLHYSMFHGDHAPNNTSAMSLASVMLFDFAGLAECLLYICMNSSTKKGLFQLIHCGRMRKYSIAKDSRQEVEEVAPKWKMALLKPPPF